MPPRSEEVGWLQKTIYVCSRQGSGGKSHYQPTKGFARKIPSKRTGCPCHLTVKTYPGTTEVLGLYKSEHSHPIGDENLGYTRLDVETRKEIENYLRLGVEPKKVLEIITKNMYHETNLDSTRSSKANRRHFATCADVRRIQKMIEEEAIRLAAQDGPSVLEWAKKLESEGHFWGHGMPAAWMTSSNAKEVTIDHFLATILVENPDICPSIFMSDFDKAQLNAMKRRYSRAKRLLCWWHVLHAWQGRFSIHNYPELWEKLKRWIRVTDPGEFAEYWAEIQVIAPKSFVDYLKGTWMDDATVQLWSAVFRTDRGIFEMGDTNMLVENRRLDHLIHVLYDIAIPHFIARHRRQEMGFEGPDLEMKHRIQVAKHAASIPMSEIQRDPETGKFIVRSQSSSEIFYEVDLEAYDCTCLSFPLIHFCKHICAVQHHFPENSVKIPVTALNTTGLGDSEDSLEGSEENDADTESDSVASADGTEADDIIAQLTEHLQFLALRFRLDAPTEISNTLRESVLSASQALDTLSTELPPSRAILPKKKVKIAANQHSWSETRAVMGVPVKNRK
ncbi:hypothetical protein C8J57DRAFT_1043714, partial [Mycena rebaudengoi]